MEQSEPSLRKMAYLFTIIIGICIVFFVLKELQEIFIPLVIAYMLFQIFSPLNRFLFRKKGPLWLAILIDILIMFVVFGGVSLILVGTLSRFSDELPGYADKLSTAVTEAASSLGIKSPALQNFQLKDLLKAVDLKVLAGNLFTSAFTTLGGALLVLFFFIFIMTGHQIFFNALKKRFSEKGNKTAFQNTFPEINDQVNRYFITKTLTSLSNAVVEGLIIWIWGVDFALIWAVIIFFLNFIPNLGSIIALTLPCILALVQFSLLNALLLGLILLVIDEILGSLIEPKIFGESLDINPLVILLALLVWGYIWGIVGALLSVPLVAIFKIAVSKFESPNMVFINDLMSSKST